MAKKQRLIGLGVVLIALPILLLLQDFRSGSSHNESQEHLNPAIVFDVKSEKKVKLSQILVLGMHHSATSLASKLVMMMGAYGGEMSDMVFHNDPNVRKFKFWERRDVIRLNQRLFDVARKYSQKRKGFARWTGFGFDVNLTVGSPTYNNFPYYGAQIISKLNEHRPWVTKEPRMCVTFPLWKPLFDESFVCLLVYRHPVEIMKKLNKRGSFKEKDWLRLWENYTVGALEGCNGQPKLILLQNHLGRDPYNFTDRVFDDLVALGVPNLTRPTHEEVHEFLRQPDGSEPSFKFENIVIQEEDMEKLSPRQRCLVELFEKGIPFEWNSKTESSQCSGKLIEKEI